MINDHLASKIKKELIEHAETNDTKNGASIKISGDSYAAGHDININKREIKRIVVQPGPEHITSSQARKLQGLISKAVDIEAKAGIYEGNTKRLYSKWWAILKRRYDVEAYQLIPAHLGDNAIAWLGQRVAMLRPKLRKTDKESWKNEHCKAIWARSKNQLGMSKGEVYALVYDKFGIKVTSLKLLSDANLKHLYNIIMAMKS